jgi:hypothetical protein
MKNYPIPESTIVFVGPLRKLLLSTPDGCNWYRPEEVAPPYIRNEGYRSPLVWIALENGEVHIASLVYVDWHPRSVKLQLQPHHWMIHPTTGDAPYELKAKVVAWSLIQRPPHPLEP